MSNSNNKEEALLSLLEQLDTYAPLIPDKVTDYHLARGGLETSDLRLKRLLALATQKFITDIATDAMQFAKVRLQQAQKEKKSGSKIDKKTVLMIEDLANAMQEHGVPIKKPSYYQ